MAMPEGQLKNDILDWLAVLDVGLFWQNDSVGIKGRKRQTRYRPNGVPDILGLIDGQFIGIEVKTKTGKILASQETFRTRFVAAGGIYILARSLEDVFEVFKIKGFC